MDKRLQSICDSLDELSESIINSWSDDRDLNTAFGWHHPVTNRYDLAIIPRNISQSIKDANIASINDDLIEDIENVPDRIQQLRSNVLPYFYNGHGKDSIPAFISTMDWVNALIQPLIGWKILNDTKAMPNKIARRLNSLNAQIDAIVPEKGAIEDQINLINEATETAETLPTDLQSLKKARREVQEISKQTNELIAIIKENLNTSKASLDKINQKEREANTLVEKCEEAYRITTTKGLASAFAQRASNSSYSMWVWVLGLLIALCAGTYIGSLRFEILNKFLQSTNPDWKIIWVNLSISLVSLSAPIWFAWIATKQIAQRFRLAEDYHFKASVAKAYEGYRKEANRLDEQLELRLFNSALTRLEEAPLRLMENENHGSPFHELISSPQFEKALDKIPELKDKLIEISNNVSFKKNGKNKSLSPLKELEEISNE